MKYNFPYLKDKAFLKQIDEMKVKEQFVKITLLNWDEDPLQDIQGKIINGNLNVDGKSSVRRTCSFSMKPDDEIIGDIGDVKNLISTNKKIALFIGFKNTLDYYKEYKVLWFPLGIFVIVGASFGHSTDGVTINLQLKDKMCLLNGEVGGTLPASVIFHEYETYDDSYLKVSTDILAADGHYTSSMNLLETADVRSEVLVTESDGNYSLILDPIVESGSEIVINQPTIFQIIQELVNHYGNEALSKIIISDVPLRVKKVMKWTGTSPVYGYYYGSGSGTDMHFTLNQDEFKMAIDGTALPVPNDNSGGTAGIFTSGQNIGFTYTDFVYPEELIGNAGDNVCTILDKIKNTLGNFEYFYDIEGNFVFQEIKNYLNTTQAKVELNNMMKNDYLIDMSKGKSLYTFENAKLINSFNNNPQYNMIKNDFIVWGIRENPTTGIDMPIRYHLAIDSKPKTGNSYNVLFYTDPNDKIVKCKVPVDYPTFDAFPTVGIVGVLYRDLSTGDIYLYKTDVMSYALVPNAYIQTVKTYDWRSELYLQGAAAEPRATNVNYYYAELANEWPKIYDIANGKYWKGINPTDMDFFLDFIGDDSEISKFSISNIGRRQKVVNNDKVNCLFEPTITDIVILEKDNDSHEMAELRKECLANGQSWTQVETAIYSQLALGKNYNSAYNAVRELLYQYTSYNESISISVIPIYYLEPNNRITVRDNESGIYGDYMINSFTLPLDVTSFMNINCTRAIERV